MSGEIKPDSEISGEVEIILDRGDTGLGFNIQGGSDAPFTVEDNGVFVVKIRSSGAAYKDGRLKEGDKIVMVNGTKLDGMTHVEAVNSFLDAGEQVSLVVIPGALAAIERKREAGQAQAAKGGLPVMKIVGALTGVAAVGAAGFMIYKHFKPRTS